MFIIFLRISQHCHCCQHNALWVELYYLFSYLYPFPNFSYSTTSFYLNASAFILDSYLQASPFIFLFFHFFVVSLQFLYRCFQRGGFLLKLKECIHVHIILTFVMLLLASSAPFFSILFVSQSMVLLLLLISSCSTNFICCVVAGLAVGVIVWLAFNVIIILVAGYHCYCQKMNHLHHQ